MNITETYWSVGEESLHTFARSIQSLNGLMAPPEFRGEDVMIPYLPGEVWVPKVPGARYLSLGITLLGIDIDDVGGTPTQEKFQSNWNDLVRLLWRPGEQFALTKRFYDNGELRTATALVEFAGGMEPTMMGRNGAKAVVKLKLADPYFYDDTLVTHNLVNGDQTKTIRGNAPTRNIIVTFNGARAYPQVRIKSPGIDHQVEYHNDLSSGDVATLYIREMEAITDPAATPAFDSETEIRHTGAPYWLELRPGDNVINLTSDSGAGSVQLQVRGAWT